MNTILTEERTLLWIGTIFYSIGFGYVLFSLKRRRSHSRQILVICPAFVTDCLETLEEIAITGKEIFEGAGGDSLTLLPCMNDHPSWISFLSGKIEEWLH